MARRRKRGRERTNEGLRLTDKRHPREAMIASVIGIVSIVVFGVLCFMSGESRGTSGIEAGAVGILCVVASITGFIVSWVSLHKENIRPTFPTIGVIVNGLTVLFYLLVYIWGTSV